MQQLVPIMQSVADRLTQRGTRLSFGVYHQAVKGCWWYTPKARQKIRHDWVEVAARYLRRFLPGTVWSRGGHHVALIQYGDTKFNFGPAIVEVRSKREDGPTMLRDGDRPVRLALDRIPEKTGSNHQAPMTKDQ